MSAVIGIVNAPRESVEDRLPSFTFQKNDRDEIEYLLKLLIDSDNTLFYLRFSCHLACTRFPSISL
jgi:hypothetical protein